MAVNVESLEFYDKNVLRTVENWNILSGAVVRGTDIIISTGGAAGFDLSNNYNNGLKPSKYRSISISIALNITQSFNYENYVEVVLVGKYTDSDGNKLNSYQSINLTYLDSSIVGGIVTMNRILTMQNFEFDSLTIYVINHTADNITLKSCVMKRSQDISGSQVGESIGFSITLSKVVAYLDGCEVYYDGEETPTKMWWTEDELGAFSGVNIDNERLIKFDKKNEILLD